MPKILKPAKISACLHTTGAKLEIITVKVVLWVKLCFKVRELENFERFVHFD